jgi:hypothetical protein
MTGFEGAGIRPLAAPIQLGPSCLHCGGDDGAIAVAQGGSTARDWRQSYAAGWAAGRLVRERVGGPGPDASPEWSVVSGPPRGGAGVRGRRDTVESGGMEWTLVPVPLLVALAVILLALAVH